MERDDPPNIFFCTECDASDFNRVDRYRLDETIADAPMVVRESIITLSEKPFVRNTFGIEADRFLSSDAPAQAKEAFKKFQENHDAHRP